MPKSSNTITTAEDMLKRILHMLEESQERSTSGNGTSNVCRIYTNKELMKLLGVESRYLKNLRDNGYLSYSRHGDKFWYTQNDVDTFLRRFKYEAFANIGGCIG
ncbi:DNA-binding protein [Bacteroides thetaiotaomicron]|uniref:Helix-turn-helix domain-containing protein n=1 Tax=Bacteroides thetaiotaomicron TaxID=818 RepID=A0A7J5JWR7_BACT4|nr:helix-turn-helix domain-containing protein [Bacteroides thetaiotaomicron]KAB4426068.1 helix-turn-helix domain-containing protein [Bacteroides thetaiotaomicron]KAB4434078.1 helix-turn-helix domain-containing protein [Bacteroides thetaiotaomicron]KAB4437644.1 helix-turn-helix domain-containing protein [Bacteroides thetaiotaomicron]KAB4442219.1 helix-turn-helix domain-containing protein [Bacteroides thetaiotaomicron]KAB4455516.1 helix-turn-helix domain-containing protein [Bacteroides thetaiota